MGNVTNRKVNVHLRTIQRSNSVSPQKDAKIVINVFLPTNTRAVSWPLENLVARGTSLQRKTKISDAQHAAANPKVKAKVKTKARAEPEKANAGVLRTNEQEPEDDLRGHFDSSQTR